MYQKFRNELNLERRISYRVVQIKMKMEGVTAGMQRKNIQRQSELMNGSAAGDALIGLRRPSTIFSALVVKR
jgi:hypothetical protein